jgi:rubrerythrin
MTVSDSQIIKSILKLTAPHFKKVKLPSLPKSKYPYFCTTCKSLFGRKPKTHYCPICNVCSVYENKPDTRVCDNLY